MAELSAKFSIIDQMSDAMANIAESGQNMADQLERAGSAANDAFGDMEGYGTTTASSVDGVAQSLESLQETSAGASASTGDLADALEGYGAAAEEAAGSTDYWTDAVGNYDKSMLEAVYSTEELVEMGMKSAEALQEESEAMELCERMSNYLNEATEASVDIHDELAETMQQAATAIEEMAENQNLTADASESLEQAAQAAADAMLELTNAQQEAQAAAEEYDAIMASGTTDLQELEAAAERAGLAAEDLAEANEKAADATEELAKEIENANEQSQETEESGVSAIENVAGALASAGITAVVKEITESVYELADAFSEAESTVVLATGATGDALDSLNESMMEAYSESMTGTLDETAAAIGEINTRLGYTGDTLTDTTELFLNFAAATGGSASSSVASITKLMNQWNVDASEMESVLDKLTYAGQASGISVDSLTSMLTTNKAVLDQLGFSLDEATAMFMEFELSGTQATTVMTGFRTALSSGDISSLEDLYSIFDQIASGAITATEASEIFGSRAGPAIVNAVNNGTFELDEFVAALENSSGTLQTTAEEAQTLSEKWEQASNNISSAFTSAVEPTIESISSSLAGLANQVGDFLNEHPTVTKAITAIGTGLAAAATGVAAVTAALTIGKTAVELFGASLSVALGPLTAIAAAVATVSAAVLILKGNYDDAYDEAQSMNAVTVNQTEELENLTEQYNEVCESLGADSDEAAELKYQIDDLSASIDENGQSVSEWISEMEAVIDTHESLMSSCADTYDSIEDEQNANLALIAKLNDLATASDGSTESQTALKTIIDSLNESIDGLDVTYEDLIENQEASIEAIKEAAKAQAEAQEQEALWEEYIELISQAESEEEALTEATNEVTAAQDRLDEATDDYYEKFDLYTANGQNALGAISLLWSDEKAIMDACGDELEEATAMQEELAEASEETAARIAEIEDELGLTADATDELSDSTMSFEEAAETAYESLQTSIEELCTAYDEAYEAALESFEGQFDLFDEAQADMETTVASTQDALDSQLSYWEDYNANLETLTEYGDTLTGEARENYEALLEYASDGSEEAAGLAASMAEAIESGNEAAVEELSNTLSEVSAAQEEAAATTADWQTNFSAQMQDYVNQMTEMSAEMVTEMDNTDEVVAVAKEMMSSYASQITSSGASAVSAAKSIASQVSAALSAANTSINVTTSSTGYATGTTNSVSDFVVGEAGHELIRVPGHASGTLDGESFYIAGENGPEFIVDSPGSTVFPTSETDRLINALNDESSGESIILNSTSGSDESTSGSDSGTSGTTDEKRIILEINGSGEIDVTGSGTDTDSILDILTENIKPVLMSILKQEIYEEGDLAYDY